MSTAQIICLVLCGSAIAIALTNIIYLIATRPESFKRDKRNDDTTTATTRPRIAISCVTISLEPFCSRKKGGAA